MTVSKRIASLLAIACGALCATTATGSAGNIVLDRSMATAGAKVLQIDCGGGDVVLVPGDTAGTSVHLSVEQNGPAPTPHVDVSHSGNRLVVNITAASGSVIPFAASATMIYTVSYPARMRVDLRATSGNVQVAKPIAAVEIFDQNGTIAVDSPRATITVENAHGDIAVTHAQAAIDLAADNGTVTADLVPGWSGGEVRMQSGNGDLHLAVPPGLRAKVDISSAGGGTVHNEFGKSNARTPLIWLYTTNGNVWLTVAR